jgi:hypothetical protein
MEAANQEIDGRPIGSLGEDGRPKLQQGFGEYLPPVFIDSSLEGFLLTFPYSAELTKAWIEDNLDIYKARIPSRQATTSIY